MVRGRGWLTAGVFTCTMVLLAGCMGGGGGSGSGAAARPGEAPVILQMSVNKPYCIQETEQNSWTTVSGSSIASTVIPKCNSPTTHKAARMVVGLRLSAGYQHGEITHYDWQIPDWDAQPPFGRFDGADEGVEFDPENGRYRVRTIGPEINYQSALLSDLEVLGRTYVEVIEVTAWTDDGKFTTGTFLLNIGSEAGGTTITAWLSPTDSTSRDGPSRDADYFALTGAGVTTISMTSQSGFDSLLRLYNANRQLIASDDDSGGNLQARLTTILEPGQLYYLEATSFTDIGSSSYVLTASSGNPVKVSDPWGGRGSCADIAGIYSVSEQTTVTTTYKGRNSVKTFNSIGQVAISQNGCSFTYESSDRTGFAAPIKRTGSLSGNTFTMSGQNYLAQNPALQVTKSSLISTGSASGTVLTLGELTDISGSYNGSPVKVVLNTTATLTRK